MKSKIVQSSILQPSHEKLKPYRHISQTYIILIFLNNSKSRGSQKLRQHRVNRKRKITSCFPTTTLPIGRNASRLRIFCNNKNHEYCVLQRKTNHEYCILKSVAAKRKCIPESLKVTTYNTEARRDSAQTSSLCLRCRGSSSNSVKADK